LPPGERLQDLPEQDRCQILDELLGGYDFPVDKRLIERYPSATTRPSTTRATSRSSARLCQEWGISYFFEHGEGKHRLVLVDNMGAYRKSDSAAYHEVDYHAPGWKVDAEYISSFVPHNHLTSGSYASRDYDYTRPRADLSIGRSDPRTTGQADARSISGTRARAGSHYAQPRAGSADANANDPQGEGRHWRCCACRPCAPTAPAPRPAATCAAWSPAAASCCATTPAEGQCRIPGPGHPAS
jgi:type VI secretion system secreted protein VgrG